MSTDTTRRLAIIGTVGVPGKYGGFETLAENLVRYHHNTGRRDRLAVYCSANNYPEQADRYLSAELEYLPLSANGAQSIPYDVLSMLRALRRRETDLLVLGVSGCIFLPVLRMISRARVICNIDGIEWKREKWQGAAKWFLRLSEKLAVRHSDVVIADNEAIAEYIRDSYGKDCHVIAYGGDHALDYSGEANAPEGLPDRFALALCRIEPENNVHVILEALDGRETPLVFVGNWDNSAYGRDLKARYGDSTNLYLLDPIYDPRALYAVRKRALVYLHGHSAGGTNPSLVEMMHFGVPILAHGCTFNRHTTEGKARYFQSPAELAEHFFSLDPADAAQIGSSMQEIAQRKYTWDQIGKAYFDLLDRP